MKLQHGEYVSLGKVEAILKLSKYVENCCLFGNSFETYTILLVVPGIAALEELAAEQGVAGQLEDLCGNASLLQVVLKDVQKIGRESKRSFLEFLVIVVGKFGSMSLLDLDRGINREM